MNNNLQIINQSLHLKYSKNIIVCFMKKYIVLNENQFGINGNKSVADALVYTDFGYRNLDQNKPTACDIINHNIKETQ